MTPLHLSGVIDGLTAPSAAIVAAGHAAGEFAASWWAVAATLITAGATLSVKYAIEIYKLIRDEKRDRREMARAPDRANAAVALGLRESDRHQNQNWLVLKTIERLMREGGWLPMEYHVVKLSVLPMPAWADQQTISELSPNAQEAVVKFVRMLPNFQYEYDQALLLIEKRDRRSFEVVLKTLIKKAEVGMGASRSAYENAFGHPLHRLEPDLESPLDGPSPTKFEKPIDMYPRPDEH